MATKGSTITSRQVRIVRSGGGGGGGGGGGSGVGSLRMALAAIGGTSGGISSAIHEIAANPNAVVASRVREKADLQELNDRFATYIERVRFLEADNKRLHDILTKLKAKFEELERVLKEMYEGELAQARKTIDETTKAKAAVEIRVAGLEQDLAEYKRKWEEEVAAHIFTKESIPKLEKAISERDAQIDYLTKNISVLEFELGKMKSENGKLQRDLQNAKMIADEETVARVELESRLQTKDDEIAFLKSMYEEKIRQLMDWDFGTEDFRAMFSNELALALKDIRAEYDGLLEANRGADTESWYKAKFDEMVRAGQRSNTEVTTTKEELRNARGKYNELLKIIMELKASNAALLERVAALEAELEAELKAHEMAMAERDVEIEKLRAQIASQILELKALMDSKLALSAEISTYRRLLQAEENRSRETVEGTIAPAPAPAKGPAPQPPKAVPVAPKAEPVK